MEGRRRLRPRLTVGAAGLAVVTAISMSSCAATLTAHQWFLLHRQEVWRVEEDQVAAQGTVIEIMNLDVATGARLIRVGAAFEKACAAVGRDASDAQAHWQIPATASGSDTPQKDLVRVETDGIAYLANCRRYENGDESLATVNQAAGSFDDAVFAWLRSLA